jgi:glyoxylase-like metal-dependent hydrolase (beta-lactamase superfamily II)
MVEAVVIEAQMPPGVLGPDAATLDVRCFLVAGANGIVLVDAGLPGTAGMIEAALGRIGGRWSDVTDIVLTHAHFDHVGGLAEARDRSRRATVWAGALDVASVNDGGVIRPLGEGDRVGELLVLDSPGHTPGHISLLHEAGSLVLIGDLLGSVDDTVSFGPPAFTADPVRSRASLERVLGLGVDRLLFSHGPELPGSSELARDLVGSSDPA